MRKTAGYSRVQREYEACMEERIHFFQKAHRHPPPFSTRFILQADQERWCTLMGYQAGLSTALRVLSAGNPKVSPNELNMTGKRKEAKTLPRFLEDKLKKEYGDNPHAVYGTLNKIGAMRGNKITKKGMEMEKKHEKDMGRKSGLKK